MSEPTFVKIQVLESDLSELMQGSFGLADGEYLELAPWAKAMGSPVSVLIESLKGMEDKGYISVEWFTREEIA